MRIALSIILAGFFLTLTACAASTEGEHEANPAQPASPVGSWSLTKIEDENYDLPGGARTPTMTITADGAISGQAGINRYNGKADADAMARGLWSAGGVVMTRMAGKPEAMTFEQRFIAQLQRADTFETGPQWLELRAGDRELLRFARSGQ